VRTWSIVNLGKIHGPGWGPSHGRTQDVWAHFIVVIAPSVHCITHQTSQAGLQSTTLTSRLGLGISSTESISEASFVSTSPSPEDGFSGQKTLARQKMAWSINVYSFGPGLVRIQLYLALFASHMAQKWASSLTLRIISPWAAWPNRQLSHERRRPKSRRLAAAEVRVSSGCGWSQGERWQRRPKWGRAVTTVVLSASSGDSWSRCEQRLKLDDDGARLNDGGDASGHDVRRSRLVASSFPSYPSRLAFLFLHVHRQSLFLFEF
jgi:hypothetical protein